MLVPKWPLTEGAGECRPGPQPALLIKPIEAVIGHSSARRGPVDSLPVHTDLEKAPLHPLSNLQNNAPAGVQPGDPA